MRDPLPFFVSKKCLRYEVEPREKRVFAISQIFCHKVLKPVINSATDTLSAAALVHQMEKLWEESKSLNGCQYLSDIDIKTSKQRQKFGFPSSCVVWPNLRNKLDSFQEISGLHSPYGYVAGDTFGAVFNCHREDFDLHSVNFFHTGRKIWIVIHPSHCITLEQKVKSTQGYFNFLCS